MSTTTDQLSSINSDRTEGHAASAAYIVTRDTSSTGKSSHPVLDEYGKLSAAGAATSLKQARAQDLPSFPSQGGVSLASAGAAASLAESNKKPFEYWKPGEIPAANKAAMQAKDYEMDPLWKPELSRAGSRAAVLAQRNTKSPDAIYTPPENQQGASAAGVAQSNKYSPDAITNREVPVSDQRKALMAATGAMAGSRRRADSAPIRPQAATNNSKWALQAATSSHRSQTPTEFTTGDPGFEAARVQNIAKNKVNRQMYGSAPPVSIEVQEKNRQDMLKASAVAMARQMYAVQQAHIDEARGVKNKDNIAGARNARNRSSSDVSGSMSPQRYENLEEAARRLAQERLAKIHDEHAEYRQYYGAQSPPKQSKLSSLNLRNRRNRASTLDQDSDDSDEEQSRRIRSQMSIFTSKLAEVDSKKRQADRDALLEAAHKNVTKQMNLMDEKVFKDTGKASPQQRELWERQARERAQRDSDDRMMNVGRVHIGGGKYLDQSEIDAIARARLQPTLDDITEKAEQQRARDEEIRLEQARQKREAENEKMRQREIDQGIKYNQQKEKEEERARKAEEKRIQKEESAAAKEKSRTEAAAEKEKRQAEKAAEREKARLEKEEKTKSKEDKAGRFSSLFSKTGAATAGAAGVATGATVAGAESAAHPPTTGPERSADDEVGPTERTAEEEELSDRASPELGDSDREEFKSPETPSSPAADRKEEPTSPPPALASPTSPAEPTSPSSPRGDKVKSWFKTRFRSVSKAQNDQEALASAPADNDHYATKKEDDTELPRSDSMRDVAMAGRKDTETDDLYGDSNDNAPVSPVKDNDAANRNRSPSISSLSSYGDEPAKSSREQPDKATADAAPPRTSTERPPSETQESDGEPRGRKGFRQRLLSKVKRDKNKDKDKNKTVQGEPTVEQQAASMPDAGPMPEVDNQEEDTGKTVGTDKGEDEAKDTSSVKMAGEGEPGTQSAVFGLTPDGKVYDDTSKPSGTEDDADEARDTFAEEKLAPPPKLSDTATASPTRGSRERSRFTEDL